MKPGEKALEAVRERERLLRDIERECAESVHRIAALNAKITAATQRCFRLQALASDEQLALLDELRALVLQKKELEDAARKLAASHAERLAAVLPAAPTPTVMLFQKVTHVIPSSGPEANN